ncbi:MAG: ABC transporter ATP-binding protein [Planctomycetes bacterium]|nr:ABC transporter ATP-binding protein [Planctomycetota bacterium]
MKTSEPEIVVATDSLVKRFGERTALDGLTCAVPRGRVVGLVGRNGSGKTTLLRCLQGLYLPTSGAARLFGTESARLAEHELARVGVVHQENRMLPWMSGRAHLDFVRTFFDRWDEARERRLVDALDLDLGTRIGALSPGNLQKLAIVTAVCHRPDVLLLDEPAASLDPTSREALLENLLGILREDEPAILISSHLLRDVERTVDWILCLDRGLIVVDDALDVLQERYAEWRVTSQNGALPARFAEPWVLAAAVEGRQAVLTVEAPEDHRALFEERYHATVESRPLGLERMFPLWMSGRTP